MRCLALFTGGLDSQIAVRLLLRQGIEVIGIFVQTPFTPPFAAAEVAAASLQIELRRIDWERDYFSLLQRPHFKFAEELAPCLDCRIGMVSRARELMLSRGASFLISGEVVGQRPSSLRSRDLETIAVHGDADDLLLRPLSALLLPPTLPERNGWVDRSQFFGWHGRGRKEQLAIAREWKLVEPAGHAPGCSLLEPTYAGRLRQLLAQNESPPLWQLRTLKIARHFWRENAHLVVAKNQAEATELKHVFASAAATKEGNVVLLEPANFRGPVGLLVVPLEKPPVGENILQAAATVIGRFSKNVTPGVSFLNLLGWSHATTMIPPPTAVDDDVSQSASFDG